MALILMFHAFTKCDPISFFDGKGKSSAWDMGNKPPDIKDIFLAVAETVMHIPNQIMVLKGL